MADPERRKDLIYPTNDTNNLNGAQFDGDISTSPSHEPNGVVHKTSAPIQIGIENGFCSEDDSEGSEVQITMSRNCGQAELRKIKEEASKKHLNPLVGKYVELPDSQEFIDERVQSTYTLFTKSNSKSLPHNRVNQTSISAQSSPSHRASLQPTISGKIRCASPELGRRIKSNPFLVQDRLSRCNLTDLERQRLDTAPAKVSPKPEKKLENAQELSAASERGSSRSFSGREGSPSRKDTASVDIQSRIKLWTEKEKEAKEIKEVERVRSPPQKAQSDPIDTKETSPIKSVFKVLKSIAPSPEQSSSDKKLRKISQEGKDVYSSSSSLGSPTRSPAKKSRWKLKSPLFGRKKTASTPDISTESASDDNMLAGSDDQLAGDKKTPMHKISSRGSNKRKAMKKRLSSAFGLPHLNSESKAVDDNAIPSKKSIIHDLRPRSNSVGPKQRTRVNNRRAASQPEITPHSPEPLTAPKLTVTSPTLNGHIPPMEREDSFEDTLTDIPVVLRKGGKGRKGADAKDRTISRDIRDIIDSLGTGSLDRNDSKLLKAVVEEEVAVRVQSMVESVPSPEMALDIVIHSPTDEGTARAVSNVFSDEEEAYIPRGGSIQNCGPIMSSLDTGTRRAIIKRRLSDSTKVMHSTKANARKGRPQLRVGSLSPTEDSSDGVIATSLMYADAVWDRMALDDDELSFSVGDAIEILDMTDDVWWYGSVSSINGWFPASFVRLRIGQDSDEDSDSVISGGTASPPPSHETPPPSPATEPPRVTTPDKPTEDKIGDLPAQERRRPSRHQSGSVHRRMTIRRKDSAPSQPRKLTSAEVRAKVIEEIVSTERDYVRHLEDIIEGYVKRCRGYNKLFDEEKVETIFSNVEAIYTFQKDFLQELEASINRDKMEDTQIGEVFVNNRHEFDIYCQYCNNHPHAVNEMNQLQENEQYTFFFESCRLLRNLQDISLEGFLLTPVQKICKYPLQLTELLKYTSEDHPDHQHVVAARDAMREVAMHINEMKRRMENIGKMGRWQTTIEGWKGDDILEGSSQMLKTGELHKISKGRSQERHFFLFDHQLIYCKKDAIGGKLTFKGRVDLDQCQITDMEDGTAMHGGNVVKNAWRMNNKDKDKWYIIFARSPEEKKDWMEAFKKERDVIKEDQERKFHVSVKMKRLAVALSASTEQARRGRRKSSSVAPKNRVPLVESVDSATRHKISSQKLAGSPNPKSKTLSKKKRTS